MLHKAAGLPLLLDTNIIICKHPQSKLSLPKYQLLGRKPFQYVEHSPRPGHFPSDKREGSQRLLQLLVSCVFLVIVPNCSTNVHQRQDHLPLSHAFIRRSGCPKVCCGNF
jgi:hypothetical protein